MYGYNCSFVIVYKLNFIMVLCKRKTATEYRIFRVDSGRQWDMRVLYIYYCGTTAFVQVSRHPNVIACRDHLPILKKGLISAPSQVLI